MAITRRSWGLDPRVATGRLGDAAQGVGSTRGELWPMENWGWEGAKLIQTVSLPAFVDHPGGRHLLASLEDKSHMLSGCVCWATGCVSGAHSESVAGQWHAALHRLTSWLHFSFNPPHFQNKVWHLHPYLQTWDRVTAAVGAKLTSPMQPTQKRPQKGWSCFGKKQVTSKMNF